jgi:hypothetical protein
VIVAATNRRAADGTGGRGPLAPGLAMKKPTQKNPKKTHKKPIKNGFLWFFLFLIFMKIIQTFLFETDFL